MKEQDETPAYEAESHSEKFLEKAVAKKRGKGKKHEPKVKEHKKVAHKR